LLTSLYLAEFNKKAFVFIHQSFMSSIHHEFLEKNKNQSIA
jgi:hypothetical protein